MSRVAVIGGGAAGLAACVSLAREGVQVDLFEQNAAVGKKILVSGNGHCNISNTILQESDYIGECPDFIAKVLRRFTCKDLARFLGTLGIVLQEKAEGRLYPCSDEAKSVVFAFESTLDALGVILYGNAKIERIERKESFSLYSDTKKYEGYDCVLVTTGLLAAPKLGGTRTGCDIAVSFGHKVFKPYPVLVPLCSDAGVCSRLSGVKRSGEVGLLIDGKLCERKSGDILFTKYGVSGLAVLDISYAVSLALQQKQKVEIVLNLLPEFTPQSFVHMLQKSIKKTENIPFSALLGSLVSLKIALVVLKELDIEKEIPAAQAGTKLLRSVANFLCNLRIPIEDTRGFSYAEAAGGGIDTCELDAKTLVSQKCRGLYFAGEVLDVTGRRGGFNLHFAFASGFLAAKAIARDCLSV
jgi:predicted Rossmann fold flavoprotein